LLKVGLDTRLLNTTKHVQKKISPKIPQRANRYENYIQIGKQNKK